MARTKLKLAWIPRDSTRRRTLRKRKRALMKKVHELSGLCGVQACAIVYDPDEPAPEVWPSDEVARRVATEFKELPEAEQARKRASQESFIQQRIMTIHERLLGQVRATRESEVRALLLEALAGIIPGSQAFSALNPEAIPSVSFVIEKEIEAVQRRIDAAKKRRADTQEYMMMDMSGIWTEELTSGYMDSSTTPFCPFQ